MVVIIIMIVMTMITVVVVMSISMIIMIGILRSKMAVHTLHIHILIVGSEIEAIFDCSGN